MQYFRFFLSVITSASLFSYGACAMDKPDDAPKRYQTSVRRCTVPPEMAPEEVIEELEGTDGLVKIHVDDEVFFPALEYYTMCGANNGNCAFGRRYLLERDEIIRENFIKKEKIIPQTLATKEKKFEFYSPKAGFKCTEELISKMSHLSQIFFHNTDLDFILARALATRDNFAALDCFAEAIKKATYYHNPVHPHNIDEYLGLFYT